MVWQANCLLVRRSTYQLSLLVKYLLHIHKRISFYIIKVFMQYILSSYCKIALFLCKQLNKKRLFLNSLSFTLFIFLYHHQQLTVIYILHSKAIKRWALRGVIYVFPPLVDIWLVWDCEFKVCWRAILTMFVWH